MAYVKHTAIHTTPKAHLNYILNPDKNEKMKYVTGICCGDDLETAETAYKYLQDFLKSDYDRIREQEQLRIQIENYHNGLEPQEDGTYKSEPEPTAKRNAELAYMDMREEQRRRAEEQRRMFEQQKKREYQKIYNNYSR